MRINQQAIDKFIYFCYKKRKNDKMSHNNHTIEQLVDNWEDCLEAYLKAFIMRSAFVVQPLVNAKND